MLLNCGVGEDFLRVPWTARRSNQSILKEISPGCSSEGLMLKLKVQYFGHLMWKADSLERTLMLGGIGGRRRRGRQRMRLLDGITLTWWKWVWVNSGRWWWTGRSGMLQFIGPQRVGHDWATEVNERNGRGQGRRRESYFIRRGCHGWWVGKILDVPHRKTQWQICSERWPWSPPGL